MKRSLALAFVVLTASLLGSCGDSSPAEPENLSANISGNWSGQATIFGSATNMTVFVSQATSDKSLTTVEPLTGTLTLNNGTPVAMTGTKQGNTWSLSGNAGATIASVHQTLTSATDSSGDFTLQVGPPSNKGTVTLNLHKS